MTWQDLAGIFADFHRLPSVQLDFHHLTVPAVLEQPQKLEGHSRHNVPLIELSVRPPAPVEVFGVCLSSQQFLETDLSRAALEFRIRVCGEGEVGGEGGQEGGRKVCTRS